MGKSADKLENLKRRHDDRMAKAEAYTENKSPTSRALAKAHARLGNDADTVVTASNSKTLGAAVGAAWGAARGVLIGGVVAAIGTAIIPLGFVYPFVVYFTPIFAWNVLKGAQDGYYKREMKSGKGKQIGDSIAATGNAQSRPVPQKIRQKAVAKAKAEVPETPVEELEEINHPAEIREEESTRWRDQIAAEGPRQGMNLRQQ